MLSVQGPQLQGQGELLQASVLPQSWNLNPTHLVLRQLPGRVVHPIAGPLSQLVQLQVGQQLIVTDMALLTHSPLALLTLRPAQVCETNF